MTDMVFLQPAESKLRNVKVSASMRIVKCNFARMRFQDATWLKWSKRLRVIKSNNEYNILNTEETSFFFSNKLCQDFVFKINTNLLS